MCIIYEPCLTSFVRTIYFHYHSNMKREWKFALSISFLIIAVLVFFGLDSNLTLEETELVSIRFLNSLLFGGVILFTYHISMLLTKHRAASLLAAFSLLFTFLFVNSFIGWTHTLSVFLILLGFYAFLKFEHTERLFFLLLLAFSMGSVFAVRYLDMLFFVPIGAYLLFTLFQKRNFRFLFLLAAVTLAFSSVAFSFHYIAFGNPLTTPYNMRPYALPPHAQTNIVKFQVERLPVNLYNVFLNFNPDNVLLDVEDSDYTFRFFKSSILQSSPFLIFSLFGFIALWRTLNRKVFWILISSLLLPVIVYASWKFYGGGWTTNMRYFSPIIPFLAVAFGLFAVRYVNVEKMSRLFFVILAGVILLATKLFFSLLQEQSYFSNYHPKAFMNDINAKAYLISLVIVLLLIYGSKRYKTLAQYGLVIILSFLLFLGFVMNVFVDGYFSFYGSKGDLFLFNIMDSNYVLPFTFIFLLVLLLIQLAKLVPWKEKLLR